MQKTTGSLTAPEPALPAARSVLIVDDEPTICHCVTVMLHGTGFGLREAQSGEACLEICRQGFRGIILMDLCMAGLSGWETIRTLAEEGLLEGSLVCLLTGSAIPPSDCAGIADAVFDYLPKPFGCEDLLAVLENASQHLA